MRLVPHFAFLFCTLLTVIYLVKGSAKDCMDQMKQKSAACSKGFRSSAYIASSGTCVIRSATGYSNWSDARHQCASDCQGHLVWLPVDATAGQLSEVVERGEHSLIYHWTGVAGDGTNSHSRKRSHISLKDITGIDSKYDSKLMYTKDFAIVLHKDNHNRVVMSLAQKNKQMDLISLCEFDLQINSSKTQLLMVGAIVLALLGLILSITMFISLRRHWQYNNDTESVSAANKEPPTKLPKSQGPPTLTDATIPDDDKSTTRIARTATNHRVSFGWDKVHFIEKVDKNEDSERYTKTLPRMARNMFVIKKPEDKTKPKPEKGKDADEDDEE